MPPFDGLIKRHRWALIASVAILAAVLALPLWLGFDYGQTGKSTVIAYRLIWKFFISGQNPQFLITETPKPLICLLYYMLPVWGVYVLISFSVVLTALAFYGISRQLTGRGLYGWLGFLYLLTTFPFSFRNILFCYWEWPYLGLTMAALWSVIGRRYPAYSFLMLLSGLIRPESWLLALFIPLLVFFTEGRRWNPICWLPVAAPLLWMLFDRTVFGDPLYSLMITARYKDVLGVAPLNFTGLLLSLPRIISANVGLPVTILGLICLLWASFRPGSGRGHRVFLAALFLPPLSYIVLSLFGRIIFMDRFIIISYAVLALYAFIAPSWLGIKPKWKVPAALALSAGLLTMHFDCGQTKKAWADSASEQRKTEITEKYLPFMLAKADSLSGNIIVPYRRKMTAAYILPSRCQARLYSFREIVYQNAVNGIDVNVYSPAVALYLEDDFTGLENGFSFLAGTGPHHLIDSLYFRRLLSGAGYTVYHFGPGGAWAPARIFETQ